jgi:hypothetical protein
MSRDIEFFKILREQIGSIQDQIQDKNTGRIILNALDLLIAEEYDKIPEDSFQQISQDSENLLEKMFGIKGDSASSEPYFNLNEFLIHYEKLNILNRKFVRFKKLIEGNESKEIFDHEEKSPEDIKITDVRSRLLSPADARLEKVLEKIPFEKFFFLPAVFKLMKKLGVVSNPSADENNFPQFISSENLSAIKKIKKDELVDFLRGCQNVLANETKITCLSEILENSKKTKPLLRNREIYGVIDEVWTHALCYALPPAERTKFNFCEFDELLHLEFSYESEVDYESEYRDNYSESDEKLYDKFKNHPFLNGEGLGRESGLGQGIKFQGIIVNIKKGKVYTSEECFKAILDFIKIIETDDHAYVEQFGKSAIIEWILNSIKMPDYIDRPIQIETEDYGISPFQFSGGEAEITFKFDKENGIFLEFVKNGEFIIKNPDNGTKLNFKNDNMSLTTRLSLERVSGSRVKSNVKSTLTHALTPQTLAVSDKNGFTIENCFQNIGFRREEKSPLPPKGVSVDLFVYDHAYMLQQGSKKFNFKDFSKDFEALQYLNKRNIPKLKKKVEKLQKDFDNYYSEKNLKDFCHECVNDLSKFVREEKSEDEIKKMAGKVKLQASQLIMGIRSNRPAESVNQTLGELKNIVDKIVMDRLVELRPRIFYDNFFNKKIELFMTFLQKNPNLCRAEIIIFSASFKYKTGKEVKELKGKDFYDSLGVFEDTIDQETRKKTKSRNFSPRDEISENYLEKRVVIFLQKTSKIEDWLIKIEKKHSDFVSQKDLKNSILELKKKISDLRFSFLRDKISLDDPRLFIEKIEKLENYQNKTSELAGILQEYLEKNKLEVTTDLSKYISLKTQEVQRSMFRCFSSANDTLIVAKKLLTSLKGESALPLVTGKDIRLIKDDRQLKNIFTKLQTTQLLPNNFNNYMIPLEQQAVIAGAVM